jgi:hypothetical protein
VGVAGGDSLSAAWRDSRLGSWQRQHVLEHVDLADMQRYSWPTGTIGCTRCIADLRDRILLMRRFRGENVYPTVRLSHIFMPTRFGGRERPHIEVKGWPDSEPTLPAMAEPAMLRKAAPPVNEQPTVAPTTKPTSEPTVKTETVKEPSLAEEMQDNLPY